MPASTSHRAKAGGPTGFSLLRALRLVARTTPLRLALFAVLSLAAAWTPLAQSGALNDFRDSHLLHSYEEAAARTISEFGEWPLWTPWSCGGLYAWGNPQTRHASPTLLLSVLMGARRAEPVVLLLFLLLGMEGAFRYARLRAGNAVGALLAAPIFGLCGFSALSWSLGWLYFLGFLLLPWVLLGTLLAARGRLVGAALVAGGFAWMLGFGGTYSVPLSAVFVVVEALTLGLFAPRGSRTQAALALGASAVFTLGACLFRLWPIWETLQSGPRVMAGSPANGFPNVTAMAFAFPGVGDKAGSAGIFFIGLLVLVLAAPAAFVRRAVFPAAMAVLAGWMATGYAMRPSPFALLRELPVFEALRYPERFLFPFALYAVVLAAIGIGVLQVNIRRRTGFQVWATRALLVATVASVGGWGLQLAAFDRLAKRSVLAAAPERTEQAFAQARGNRWIQGHLLAIDRGSISCGEGYPVPMSRLLRGDLPSEERFEDPAAGTVTRAAWSPNRLALEVDATAAGTVLVNQNWHPGWQASAGEVISREGLLAVQVPAGTSKVELVFRPRSAIAGLVVSALTALSLVALGVLDRRDKSRAGKSRRARLGGPLSLGAAALPLLVGVALASAWPEAKAEPVLTNPDGTVLRVDALPVHATPVGARFTPNIELVAAAIPGEANGEGEVPLELYWRITGPVPRTVGVFVHIFGPEGKRKSADHPVLGGTWFFKNAPRDVLIRDAFAVNPHDWEPGTWKVTVGLWHASGDGSRLLVTLPDGAPVKDSRVDLGAFAVPPRSSEPPLK